MQHYVNLIRKVDALVVGIVSLILVLNSGYLFNSKAGESPHNKADSKTLSQQPDSNPNLGPSLQENSTQDRAAMRHDISIRPQESLTTGTVSKKQQARLNQLRRELDRARMDYLKIQRQVAQELLPESASRQASTRVLQAGEALAAELALLEQYSIQQNQASQPAADITVGL